MNSDIFFQAEDEDIPLGSLQSLHQATCHATTTEANLPFNDNWHVEHQHSVIIDPCHGLATKS